MTSSLPCGQTSLLLQMTERLALSDAHFTQRSTVSINEPGSFWLTINATWFTTDWFVVCVRWD